MFRGTYCLHLQGIKAAEAGGKHSNMSEENSALYAKQKGAGRHFVGYCSVCHAGFLLGLDGGDRFFHNVS